MLYNSTPITPMTNKTALETLNNVYIANLESEITRLTKENEELQRRNKDLLCSNGSLFNHIYDNRREVKRLTLQLEKAKELIQDIFTYGTVDDNYSFHHDSSLAHQLRAFLSSQSPEPSKDVEDKPCENGCRYSRDIHQPYPRECTVCGLPEKHDEEYSSRKTPPPLDTSAIREDVKSVREEDGPIILSTETKRKAIEAMNWAAEALEEDGIKIDKLESALTASQEENAKLREALNIYLQAGHKEARRQASILAKKALKEKANEV